MSDIGKLTVSVFFLNFIDDIKMKTIAFDIYFGSLKLLYLDLF